MSLKTAPPRESIGGKPKNQLAALEFGKRSYEYLKELDEFKESDDYDLMLESDKALFDTEFELELLAYEANQARVSTF